MPLQSPPEIIQINNAVFERFDFIRVFWHANHMQAARVSSDLSPVEQNNPVDIIAAEVFRQNYTYIIL